MPVSIREISDAVTSRDMPAPFGLVPPNSFRLQSSQCAFLPRKLERLNWNTELVYKAASVT